MTYNREYFHKVLLRLKSLNFTRYMHITEYDLLIQAFNAEEIGDYNEVDWRWLAEKLYGEAFLENRMVHFNINGELESFIDQIVPREERVRILTFLRDHCEECLFYDTDYYWESISNFETECARLISQNIEESKRDEIHGGYLDWPRPNLKEIALTPPQKPEYSIMETAILKAVPKFPNGKNVISQDVLLRVAYEFIDYFRACVKAYDESGRDDKLKPCMSYKQHADKIYDVVGARANRYLYWDRTPVYQVYFILGCLMGMPDHRRSWHEEKFAEGIGDYLEMTAKFKGCKEKIKNVIQGLLTLSQYQLDFDMENVEEAMNAQTEELKQKQAEQEAQRLPKPEPPKQATAKPAAETAKQPTDCTPQIGTQNNQNCTINNYFMTPPPGMGDDAMCAFTAEDKRGPKYQFLFVDKDGNEDKERTKTEKERLMSYLRDHGMNSIQLDSSKRNELYKVVVCFCKKWVALGYAAQTISGTAVVRFLVEVCEIDKKANAVSAANVVGAMLKNGEYDKDIFELVCEYF